MPSPSFPELLTLALEIAEETQDGANSAERVGGFLIKLLKASTLPYSPTAEYEAGQYVVFGDALYRSLSAIEVAESPVLVPEKWRLLTGRDGLDDVARRGTDQTKGKTTQLLKLLGGLILGNIELTTQSLPHLLIDADGKVWQGSGTPPPPTPTPPPDTWTIGAHYIEVDGEESPIYAEVDRANFTPDSSTPSATGVYRIATPSGVVFPNLSVKEGATLQLRLEQEFSDNTWVVVSDPTWSVVTGSLTTGVTISSGGLLSVPADIITSNTYVGVNAALGGLTHSTQVTIVNLNPIEP